ncbi:unnamed protein product [Dracunculus medinensis]|uniref:PDZ domain-containing protein n=1 Tax=Dracunculus medinensis TaxID=318479 RepID=A0A0N4UFK7_DRAME|nr:unnamed protein product [Dracunculus medinensis]
MFDKDTSALGFDITDCFNAIYINNVHPNGPAERSRNILIGDKIRALTVSFEGMKLEDAIALLSCASSYKQLELQIKLELERAIVEETEEITYKDGTEEMEDREVVKNNFHVQSFKSISVEDLKIENPCKNTYEYVLLMWNINEWIDEKEASMIVIGEGNSYSFKRTKSCMTNQKYPLPPIMQQPSPLLDSKSERMAINSRKIQKAQANRQTSPAVSGSRTISPSASINATSASFNALPEYHLDISAMSAPTEELTILDSLTNVEDTTKSLPTFIDRPSIDSTSLETRSSANGFLSTDPELGKSILPSSSSSASSVVSSESKSSLPTNNSTISRIPLLGYSPKPVPLQIRKYVPEKPIIIEEVDRRSITEIIEVTVPIAAVITTLAFTFHMFFQSLTKFLIICYLPQLPQLSIDSASHEKSCFAQKFPCIVKSLWVFTSAASISSFVHLMLKRVLEYLQTSATHII